MSTAATSAITPGVSVVLIDFGGTGVSHDALVACAAALTIQATQHFALPPPYGYGIGAHVRAASGKFDVLPREQAIGLFEHPDIAAALGYHDQTAHGQPLSKVFPRLDEQDGVSWTSTASHELLEMLRDPNCAQCMQSIDGKIRADEPGDPVEADSYLINGVAVSNFVLQPWYAPPQSMQGLKYDWMGLVKKPLEIRPGGYAQWFDPTTGWHQDTNFEKAPRAYRQTAAGRGGRRQQKHLAHLRQLAASAQP